MSSASFRRAEEEKNRHDQHRQEEHQELAQAASASDGGGLLSSPLPLLGFVGGRSIPLRRMREGSAPVHSEAQVHDHDQLRLCAVGKGGARPGQIEVGG
jgi:hypothetical protein